ncbi:MAG: hypothetical protein CMJ46_16810 [Planctomyces sp.]|nr:hypothetical protein [Planctomyces sp.]
MQEEKHIHSGSRKTVKFGDVVRDVKESEKNPLENGLDRYVGLEHIEPENLRLSQWGDLTQDEVSFTKRFRKGQVLFAKRRAYQRKVAVADFDGICSSDILTFEPKGDDLLPELLPYIVQSDAFFDHALGTSSGSLSPRTRWSQLKDFEFPLPPKEEQRRIAEVLEAVSLVRSTSADTLHSLNDVFHSISENHFRLMRRKDCPKNWKRAYLGDFFEHRKETGFSEPEILAVTISGQIVPRRSLERNVIDKTGNEKYFRVETGDIVYNTMRMWQGSCGVVPNTGLVSPAYTVLSPKMDANLIEYWNMAFHSSRLLDVFKRFSVGVAADRWRLYYRDFSKIWINVPPDREKIRMQELLCELRSKSQKIEEKVALELKLMRSLGELLLRK